MDEPSFNSSATTVRGGGGDPGTTFDHTVAVDKLFVTIARNKKVLANVM